LAHLRVTMHLVTHVLVSPHFGL